NRPQQREETRSPSITSFYLKGCAQAAKTAIFGRINRGPDWPAKARDDADIAAIGQRKTYKSAGGPAGCLGWKQSGNSRGNAGSDHPNRPAGIAGVGGLGLPDRSRHLRSK